MSSAKAVLILTTIFFFYATTVFKRDRFFVIFKSRACSNDLLRNTLPSIQCLFYVTKPCWQTVPQMLPCILVKHCAAFAWIYGTCKVLSCWSHLKFPSCETFFEPHTAVCQFMIYSIMHGCFERKLLRNVYCDVCMIMNDSQASTSFSHVI